MSMERGGLLDGFFEVCIDVGTQWTPPSCPDLVLGAEVRDCAAAESAEDSRRHALFMAKPSNEPSLTERARVALVCVWMQLLKLRKTATSQGCKYDVLRGGRNASTM